MCAVICTSAPAGVTATIAVQPSTAGGSGSFLVTADDGRDYWCKSLNNFQSPAVPTNEQIVARWGNLIGVAVCTPQLVKLDGIVDWEIRPGSGRKVEAGWAHGSVAVPGAVETHALDHRTDDDNTRRQAGLFALYDWLHGSDHQWLYSTTAQSAYSSHDHGHYFPGGPDWTPDTLTAAGTTEVKLPFDASGLDGDELKRLADALDALTGRQLGAEASQLPDSWSRSNEELDALVAFAESRKAGCAERLRALVP
jgi:hypothetical protein